MKENHLIINCTETQIADIRVALSYAIQFAPTKETEKAFKAAYTTLINLIMQADFVDAEEE